MTKVTPVLEFMMNGREQCITQCPINMSGLTTVVSTNNSGMKIKSYGKN